jgi:hypothetical protein
MRRDPRRHLLWQILRWVPPQGRNDLRRCECSGTGRGFKILVGALKDVLERRTTRDQPLILEFRDQSSASSFSNDPTPHAPIDPLLNNRYGLSYCCPHDEPKLSRRYLPHIMVPIPRQAVLCRRAAAPTRTRCGWGPGPGRRRRGRNAG